MKKLNVFIATLIIALSAQAAAPASIQTTTTTEVTTTTEQQPASTIPPVPTIDAAGYVLIDANSGEVLASKNAEARLEPASTTKLMTMYIISSALKSGKIRLNDMVTISSNAWRTGGSRMFLQVGSQVPVDELIHGIVIASGNDAAVAMAEHIAGSTNNFIDIMNQTAQQLGMKNSHFTDVNGLPAHNHYCSPRDLAILAQALIDDFPDDYKAWYSQKWFQYKNIKQANRNRLLWKDPSVDGLKTGHTGSAGFCLVASAQRNDMRLISVIMGAPSVKARTDGTEALLNWGFRNFSTHQLFAANKPLATPRIWFGEQKDVPMGLAQNLFVTIPNGQYQNLKAFLTLKENVAAPIVQGQPYGAVEVTLNNRPLLSQPIVALQNNPEGNIFERFYDHLIKLFDHE